MSAIRATTPRDLQSDLDTLVSIDKGDKLAIQGLLRAENILSK